MSRGLGLPKLAATPQRRVDSERADVLVLAMREALEEGAPMEKLRAVVRYCAETGLAVRRKSGYGFSPSDPAYWWR